MDELVEGLCLAQHVHIVAVSMWHTLQELIHVEVVDESLLLTFSRGWMHIAPIGVEEGREAADEGCAYLVCAERHRADYAHGRRTTAVYVDAAA